MSAAAHSATAAGSAGAGCAPEQKAKLSQDWLNRRVEGLEPSDLENLFFFSCAPSLEPPGHIRHLWQTLTEPSSAFETLASMASDAPGDAAGYTGCVVLCDCTDEPQLEALRDFMAVVDVSSEAPPILVAHHSVAPEHGGNESPDCTKMVNDILEYGADAFLPWQPVGLNFVLDIRGRLLRSQLVVEAFVKLSQERQERRERMRRLESSVQFLLWDYGCPRLIPGIPPVDDQMPHGPTPQIPGYTTGKCLGKGAFGTVYRVHLDGDDQIQEVVKSVSKSKFSDLYQLKPLKRMTEAMIRLSTEFPHPHVTRLYQVYHSPTHIFYRMQYGGPRNLYEVLVAREQASDPESVISVGEMKSLLAQTTDGLRHLHVVAQASHRDLKSENYIVDIVEGKATIMLTDFDSAILIKRGGMCNNPVGTLPFVAPEVFLEPPYNPFVADVWSLGIVMFEVHCGTRTLEMLLNLRPTKKGEVRDVEAPTIIRQQFARRGSASSLLQAHCLSAMREVLPATEAILDEVLEVVPAKRMPTAQLAERMRGSLAIC